MIPFHEPTFITIVSVIVYAYRLTAWRIVHVVDGDTLDVKGLFRTKRIRLYGINTPEQGERGCEAATNFMRRYLRKRCTLRIINNDKYGRVVSSVCVGRSDLSVELARRGLGVWTEQYAPERTDIRDGETRAKRRQLGLFARTN